MIKRLVPVAAAVVLGLSPNLASAASHHNGGKVYQNNAMPAASSALDYAIMDTTVINPKAKGASLAGGRLTMGFEGSLIWAYSSANGMPRYVTPRGHDVSASGTRVDSAFVMPVAYRINRNVDAKFTVSGGSSPRTTYFDEIADTTASVNSSDIAHTPAGGGSYLDNLEGFSVFLQDAYMTYKGGNWAFFGGWMTQGLGSVNISPNNVAPSFHDFTEYTGVNMGVAYTTRGLYLSAAIVDPGKNDATIVNSRGADDSQYMDWANWSARFGYSSTISGHKFNIGVSYINDTNDLSYINVLRNVIGSTRPDKAASGLSVNGGFSHGKYDFEAYFTHLGKNAYIGAGQTSDNTTNDIKLWDFSLKYHLDSGSTLDFFFDTNRNGNASGLPRKQYGVKADYNLAKNTDLNAAIWHEKKHNSSNGGTTTSRNSTRAAIGVSYFLG